MMKFNKLKRLFSIAICLCLIFATMPISFAGNDVGEGILDTFKDSNNFQALTFTVNPVGTSSSIQAFAIGWNVKILDENGEVFDEVYLETPPRFSGASRKYYLPLSKGFTYAPKANEVVSASIESKISSGKVSRYRQIVEGATGSTFLIDARIQKYTYNASRNPKYLPASPATYADNMDDIKAYFNEFSSVFKDNLPGTYFDLSKTFPSPEPKTLADPYVQLVLPQNGITVLRGTVVTFKGWGTGCHHIGGFVDDGFIGQQNNPSGDINDIMWYETTVKLDKLGPHTFHLVGRNTSSTDGKTHQSATHTVYVIDPPPNSGKIYVKNIDIDTNKEIPDTAYEIPGVAFGKPETVSAKAVNEYKVLGSYQTFSSTAPDKSKMQTATTQTVTLSSTNKEAYVYFWYKYDPTAVTPKPPVKINYDPIAIINNPSVAYAGDDVLIDGSKSYDTDGYIEHYYWVLPGTDGCDPLNPWYNVLYNDEQNIDKGTVWYPNVGIYNIDLEVEDDGNCSGFDKSTIQIIEPKPSISIEVIAEKVKENRKITLDLSKSTSSKRFPIDWSLTTWSIQPVSGTGASGDYGVRLANGTVYKNINNVAYQYKGGAWQNTGLAFISVLKGQKTVYFQARDSGQYKITVSMTNTSTFNSAVHYSNTLERTITIVEDLPPIANFSGSDSNIREFENPVDKTLQRYGIIPVLCTTISPDGDPIGKRVWSARYDSDNDLAQGASIAVAFGDETTIYPYTGTEPFTSGVRLVVNGDKDPEAEIWSYEVGKYTEALQAFEDIPDNETVKELLIPSDFKSSYVQGW